MRVSVARGRRHRACAPTRPEDFGEVDGLDGDAGGFEQFLAVADGVEGGGTRADRADADAAQAVGDAADAGEPGEILAEELGIGRFGVLRGERVRDAVLREIVADRHLAAEAVAAELDGHLRRRYRAWPE